VQEVSAGRTLAAAALAGFIVTSGCQTGAQSGTSGAQSGTSGAQSGTPGAQSATPARPTSTAAGLGMAGDVAELAASANRKLMHDDGKGCLADLARLAELDPGVEKTLVVVRAQCEMLLGRCQSGKQQIADYYVREMNMSEPRALIMAESIGSMRCRGGDMSDRDTLLRALYELSDGAYMNARPAADCLKNVRLVRELAPKVPPRDPDDGQVRGGPQALFHTGAACLARAGDCAAAWKVWQDDYPPISAGSLGPKQRRDLLEESFRSSIERCKDAKLT
jgi:hypothetical protein